MSKKLKKKLTGVVVSICTLLILFVLDKLNVVNIQDYIDTNENKVNNKINKTDDVSDSVDSINNSNDFYEITRVVDGDTFVITYNGNEEKVRLIGVDTPESVHPNKEKNTEFGNEVSNYTKEMLLGKKVILEFDVEQRDKYGRLLAYVYLDGQMYNKLLLEKGYAKLATYPPNVKYVDDFTVLQKEARENKVGLWKY